MPGISVRRLSKQFGEVRAVDDVSFEAAPGSVTGLLGPNGSGKTTCLRMVLGLVRPTAGEALVGGRRFRDLEVPRRTVGAVLDADAFHPGRTGRAHLQVLAHDSGILFARVDEVLAEVDLVPAADRRVGGYSLGMRQRLGLAGALLGDPEVLVLDEPANGLDPEGMVWLRTLLRGLAGRGRTVLVSSHLLAEMAQTADDVVVMAAGQVRYAGPVAGLGADGASLEDGFLRLTGRSA